MLQALGSESVAQASVKGLLRAVREGQQSTRLVFEGQVQRSNVGDPVWHVFTTAGQGARTACLKAGGGSFGQLERCSSERQSVAQPDQRRPAVNPACFEGPVWKRNAGDLVRWRVYSELRRCGAASVWQV